MCSGLGLPASTHALLYDPSFVCELNPPVDRSFPHTMCILMLPPMARTQTTTPVPPTRTPPPPRCLPIHASSCSSAWISWCATTTYVRFKSITSPAAVSHFLTREMEGVVHMTVSRAGISDREHGPRTRRTRTHAPAFSVSDEPYTLS